MLELYHGSNVAIEKIDLSKGHINKDFGKGFYLTTLPHQAMEMAKRKARQFLDAKPIVTTFLFDENELTSGELNVKVFHTVSEEWAMFILQNRKASRTGFHHDYDIVVGPVADDSVVQQLDLFEMGLITLSQLSKHCVVVTLTTSISSVQSGLCQNLHGYEQGTNIYNGLPLR